MRAGTSPTGSGSTPATKSPLIEVRVNAGNDDDVALLAGVGGEVGVRVPKVESPDDIDRVVDAMGRDIRVTALIETAAGSKRRSRSPRIRW